MANIYLGIHEGLSHTSPTSFPVNVWSGKRLVTDYDSIDTNTWIPNSKRVKKLGCFLRFIMENWDGKKFEPPVVSDSVTCLSRSASTCGPLMLIYPSTCLFSLRTGSTGDKFDVNTRRASVLKNTPGSAASLERETRWNHGTWTR